MSDKDKPIPDNLETLKEGMSKEELKAWAEAYAEAIFSCPALDGMKPRHAFVAGFVRCFYILKNNPDRFGSKINKGF